MSGDIGIWIILKTLQKDGEGEGRVYESDEDPLDLYSPVEGKIEIKIRWQKNNLIEERDEIPQLDIFTVKIKK